MLRAAGIPKGYIVFVLGGPGSGKTTFSLQFLHHGASVLSEPGVYVTLDDSTDLLRTNARIYGMRVKELEDQKKLAFLDSTPLRSLPKEIQVGGLTMERGELMMKSLVEIIKRNVEEIRAERIVVDPITTLALQYPKEVDRRNAILDLMKGVLETGCTALFVSELSQTGLDRTYQFEEYLTQGVILLRRQLRNESISTIFQIEKMKGVNHDPQPRPYRITSNGIQVYHTETPV